MTSEVGRATNDKRTGNTRLCGGGVIRDVRRSDDDKTQRPRWPGRGESAHTIADRHGTLCVAAATERPAEWARGSMPCTS